MPVILRNKFYAKYLLAISLVVGGYLALILIDSLSGHQHKTFCLFKLATGIPCPGCGMGRATLELLHFDISKSFKYNILCLPFTLSVIVALIWMLADLFRKKETFFKFMKHKPRPIYIVMLVAIIATDWIVNIVRHI